jgi:hypothetical protein
MRRRRKKYKQDPAYRRRAQQQARDWYANPKNRARKLARQRARVRTRLPATLQLKDGAGKLVEVPVFRVGELARAVGCSRATARSWERDGVLPEASHRTAANWRLYTEAQVQCVVETYREVAASGRGRSRRMAELLRERWARMPRGVGNWKR